MAELLVHMGGRMTFEVNDDLDAFQQRWVRALRRKQFITLNVPPATASQIALNPQQIVMVERKPRCLTAR